MKKAVTIDDAGVVWWMDRVAIGEVIETDGKFVPVTAGGVGEPTDDRDRAVAAVVISWVEGE